MTRLTSGVTVIKDELTGGFHPMLRGPAMLVILDWRLALITLAFDALLVLFVRFSSKRSSRYYKAQ